MKKIQWNKDRTITWCNRLAIPLQALGVCILYFVIEWMSRRSIYDAWKFMTGSPWVFLYNALLIFASTTIVFLFRRRAAIRFIVFFFWFLLGAVNGIILSNRVTPFTGQDLGLLTDAKKIVANYMSPVVLGLIILGIVLVLLFDVWLLIKGPKYQGKRRWTLSFLLIALSVFSCIVATKEAHKHRILSSYFGNLANAYTTYGYPYCLGVTVFDTGMSQPDDYSEKMVNYILKDEDLPETSEIGKKTNIIFVQLESFFDPTTVQYLHLSEDPMPNWHALSKEYSSGMLKVPVIGAGTVNTEFSAITGMSLSFFGAGEYPYKTVLKNQTVESIPFNLKEDGYATHAIHNNEANFYSRRTVYRNLGFDTFTSEEYMPDISDTTETGWVKDHILVDEIIKTLDSTEEPDYIYTVSVQGHGDYPEEPLVEDPEITVTGAENKEKNNYSWEYYVKQIHEMDQFVKDLTDALAEYDEPAILALYGDHLPTMGLKQYDVKNWDLYKTPYIIWDNMDLKKKDQSLTAYQIGPEVLNRIGIHDGTMVRFHQSERGDRYYQSNLNLIQYDLLYGKQYTYGGTNPFQPTQLQMGIVQPRIRSIEHMPTEQWSYTIKGENFTASSRLEINGELIETTFVDPETLIVRDVHFKITDRIDIATQSNSSTGKVLTRSLAVSPTFYLK